MNTKAINKFRYIKCTFCGTSRIKVLDGSWLRDKRIQRGIGLCEMARNMGFSAAYLCDVEKNRRRVTDKIQNFYCRAKTINHEQ